MSLAQELGTGATYGQTSAWYSDYSQETGDTRKRFKLTWLPSLTESPICPERYGWSVSVYCRTSFSTCASILFPLAVMRILTGLSGAYSKDFSVKMWYPLLFFKRAIL